MRERGEGCLVREGRGVRERESIVDTEGVDGWVVGGADLRTQCYRLSMMIDCHCQYKRFHSRHGDIKSAGKHK